MAYSDVDDLLIGDLLINPQLDKQKFVDEAANEMDSKLGWVYALPLRPHGSGEGTPSSWLSLQKHETLLLASINNRLASGRLILTLNIAGEDRSLHAYGDRLVQEAQADLLLLANGDVDLSAARRVGTATAPVDPGPSIVVHDEESLLEGFENSIMRNTRWRSYPGAI